MLTQFPTREDELNYAIGTFFVKWSWLEESLTYLLESILNIDEQFCGLLHTHLSIDSKITLLSHIAEDQQQEGLHEYERDYLERLLKEIKHIKDYRNLLAHQPLVDMFGSLPQVDGLGPIGALSIRMKRSGKSDVPVVSLAQIKESAHRLIALEKGVSELAQAFCLTLGRRVKQAHGDKVIRPAVHFRRAIGQSFLMIKPA